MRNMVNRRLWIYLSICLIDVQAQDSGSGAHIREVEWVEIISLFSFCVTYVKVDPEADREWKKSCSFAEIVIFSMKYRHCISRF